MPEFFPAAELASRDAGFARMANYCKCTVMSSHEALKDLAVFAPAAMANSRVLHFVAGFGAVQKGGSDLSKLQAGYHFDEPYFHLPNQFWAHKNHRIVIEALALLASKGRRVLVLATGHREDTRQPGHFKALMQRAEELGVADRFRPLGVVPFKDLVGLMRNSIALINPSLFEGWSTTVEEGKSMGKKILLSNIAVHLEQAPPRGVFFDPDNAIALADELWRAQLEFDQTEERRHMEIAEAALPERVREFARCYQQIALEVVSRH